MDGETSSSGPPGPPRWQPMLWAGVGVLVGGLGVLGYALVVADGVYPTSTAGEEELLDSGLGLGLAAGCAVPAVVIVAWVLVVTLSGATGKLQAFPQPRFLAGTAVLIGAAGLVSCWHAVNVGGVPFPGDRALLVTAAYGFVLVGTVVVHVAGTRLWSSVAAPRPWSRRDVVGFVAGVTAVALACGATVAVAGEPARVDAATAAAVQAPPTPTDPTRVLWRWSDHTGIREAVAAGAGVVLTSAEGIIALDGRTGQERWQYRLAGIPPYWSQFNEFLVAGDGGRVVIASLDGRLHAFDAFTGELRWRDEEETAQTPPPWRRDIVATSSTVVRHRYSPVPEFVGTDVRTGEPTWRYASEHPECATGADAVDDTVIIHYWCRDSWGEQLVGLDGATGERIWSTPLSDSALVAGGVITLIDKDRGLLDPRSGREVGPDPVGLALASDSGEIITHTGSLFETGDAAPRWEIPDIAPAKLDHSAAIAATFLGDVVVLVNDRSCPGGGSGLQLIVVNRADGGIRRSLDCADLPAATSTEVISAPGAVVLRGLDELVGVG